MEIIDTHSHIYGEEFDKDIQQVIERAKAKGLTHVLLPNIDADSIERMHTLCDTYPDFCFPMMGLHPTSVGADWQTVLNQMKHMFSQRKYIAIGEIGMDLYWDKTFEEEQKQAFMQQIGWAKEFRLPIVIHSRDAYKETVACLREVGTDDLSGVFHSFGDTTAELETILSFPNFYVGINGVVTFKNSKLKDTLRASDLSRIIVETDSPYLSPVPFRGKRNESAYVSLVVEKLAEIFETPKEEVARITSENAKKLFSL